MLAVRDVVAIIPRSVLHPLLKLLVEKEVINTILTDADFYLLSLPDHDFAENYPLKHIFSTINKEDVTKLSLLYYSHYPTISFDNLPDEVRTYFTFYPNFYTLLYNTEVPTDIWYHIMEHITTKKDYISLSSISQASYTANIEYKKQHQWSLINKQVEGLTYYHNHLLTPFQVEVLNNMVEGVSKVYIPNYYNFLLCALIYAYELAIKAEKRVMIMFDFGGFDGSEEMSVKYYYNLVRDLILDVFDESKEDIIGFNDKDKHINFTFLSDDEELEYYPPEMDCLVFGLGTIPDLDEEESLRVINFRLVPKKVSDTFIQSEQTPVLVKAAKYEEELTGKTLTIVVDDVEYRENYLSFISPRLLKEYDNIIVDVKFKLVEPHPFDSLYSFLSETSAYVKRLLLIQQIGYAEIPLPFKMVKQMLNEFKFEEGRHTQNIFYLPSCGLSYADRMILYYHRICSNILYPQLDDIPRLYENAVKWLKKYRKDPLLKLTRRNNIINLDNVSKTNNCWSLIDLNDKITDVPQLF